MLKSVVFLLVLLTISVVLATKSYNGYKLFFVTPSNPRQIDVLHSLESKFNVDFWDGIHRVENRMQRMMVAPENVEFVTNVLVEYEVMHTIAINNLEEVFEMERQNKFKREMNKLNDKVGGRSTIDFDHFWLWEEIVEYLKAIAAEAPELTSLEVIGQTYQQRDIYALTISKNGGQVDPTKPVILVDSAMHAREWIAPMVALKLIHELVDHSEEYSDILDELNWVIVPVVNIDGYVYSHETDRLWRKTRKPNEGSTCVGVDPNRNFNYQWQGSSDADNPCAQTFRGFEPHSETEIQATSSLMQRYSNAGLYLSLHSYGQLFLYPFSFDRIYVNNYQMHIDAGTDAINAIRAVNQTLYEVGTSFDLLYISSGTSKDFAVAVASFNLSYTMELPGGGANGFDIQEYRIPGVVNESMKGIEALAQYVVDHVNK